MQLFPHPLYPPGPFEDPYRIAVETALRKKDAAPALAPWRQQETIKIAIPDPFGRDKIMIEMIDLWFFFHSGGGG